LIDEEGRTEGTATKELQANSGRMINRLMDAGAIDKTESGYVIIDPQFASSMMAIPLR